MWLVSTVQNGVLNRRKGSDQHNSLNSLVLARKIEVVFALKPLFGCINGGL
jgi:hypothetical protein